MHGTNMKIYTLYLFIYEFLSRGMEFSLRHIAQTRAVAHQASYRMGNRAFYPG